MRYIKYFNEKFNIDSFLQYYKGVHYDKDIVATKAAHVLDEINDLDDILILNRVIFLYDIKDLDENDLGEFWTDQEVSDDLVYQLMEQSVVDDIENKKPYVVTAKFRKSDIDLYATIQNNIDFPEEFEINVGNSKPMEVIEVKLYDI